MLRHSSNRVPNNIRYYRRRANLKLYELAHLVNNSSPANVANWEKGRKVPSLDNLLKLSEALKVPPELLYLERLKKIREDIKARRTLPVKKPL